MKARLELKGGQTIIYLSPEDDDEKSTLMVLAKETARVHIINCRGFQYLDPEVGFLVQPMPSSD